MSRLLFDFQCAKGHVHEELVPAHWHSVPCDQCDLPANRIISPVRCALEGFSGAFPSAYDKWEKRRESRMKWERKNIERHGKTGIGHDK